MSFYLILEDENLNRYNLPSSFWIDPYTIGKNSNVQNIIYSDSGRETADKFPKPGVIKIKGVLQKDTQAEFESAKNDLIDACIKGGKLLINDNIVNRYLSVAWLNFNFGTLEGDSDQGNMQDIEIEFVLENMFWIDYTENESVNVLAGDDTITINTDQTNWILTPTIIIDADQGEDLTGIVLKNASDGNSQFAYNDEFFVQGSRLVIDAEFGTVQMNNNDGLPNFSGAFIRLQPGDNFIDYEGGACTITIKYRRKYLR